MNADVNKPFGILAANGAFGALMQSDKRVDKVLMYLKLGELLVWLLLQLLGLLRAAPPVSKHLAVSRPADKTAFVDHECLAVQPVFDAPVVQAALCRFCVL